MAKSTGVTSDFVAGDDTKSALFLNSCPSWIENASWQLGLEAAFAPLKELLLANHFLEALSHSPFTRALLLGGYIITHYF
jgi:hypothetical protein